MREDPNLYYASLWSDPAFLLPIVYTPTVGEACQKLHGCGPICRYVYIYIPISKDSQLESLDVLVQALNTTEFQWFILF